MMGFTGGDVLRLGVSFLIISLIKKFVSLTCFSRFVTLVSSCLVKLFSSILLLTAPFGSAEKNL